MAAIEPILFYPREPGVPTKVALPGRSKYQQIKVLQIREGMTLSLSHFAPECEHRDHIRRPIDQILIVLNLQGEMVIERVGSNERYRISNGHAWVIHPGGHALERTVGKNLGCSNLILALDLSVLPSQTTMEIQANVPKECWMRRLELPIPGREALNSMFDDLGSPAALMRKEGQCLLLVGHAIEELSKPTRASAAQVADLLVARACALMSERLSEHLALDDLAQGLAVSHATLNRAFKNALGRTVFEELRHMRLERADTLVRQSDLSLSQVAYDCGFSSPAHMSTAFRKRFGATPKERRNGQEQIPE